ncbi:MAG: DUF4198 domain-containing protein, partial [bacterium]|nr:DUF4198 domain-containing protein [bacterium]
VDGASLAGMKTNGVVLLVVFLFIFINVYGTGLSGIEKGAKKETVKETEKETEEKNLWQKIVTKYSECDNWMTVRDPNLHVTSKLRGRVVHRPKPSKGVPEIELTLRKLGKPEIIHQIKTDDKGKFDFPRLRPGYYQLETCKSGWTSKFFVIKIKKPWERKTLNIILDLSS